MSIIWHEPNLRAGAKPWTKHESARAERLKSQGKTCAEVGAILGRTAGSVSMHLYERRMSPERAQAHKEMKNRSRQRREPVVPRSDRFLDKSIQVVNRPTPEMLADRDRREAMPHRDLTAVLCGDPPLGLSELDRKAGARA